jgi:hypothetical protein
VVKIDLFTLLSSSFSFFPSKKSIPPPFGREIGDPHHPFVRCGQCLPPPPCFDLWLKGNCVIALVAERKSLSNRQPLSNCGVRSLIRLSLCNLSVYLCFTNAVGCAARLLPDDDNCLFVSQSKDKFMEIDDRAEMTNVLFNWERGGSCCKRAKRGKMASPPFLRFVNYFSFSCHNSSCATEHYRSDFLPSACQRS